MAASQLLVISNRHCQSGCVDDSLFGLGFNQAGPCQLRVAQAGLAQGSQRWQLQLVPEDRSDPDNVCHASRALFLPNCSPGRRGTQPPSATFVKEVSGGDAHSNHWVFFVPGYCSLCREGLDKARQLQEVHGVNVILFPGLQIHGKRLATPLERIAARKKQRYSLPSRWIGRLLACFESLLSQFGKRGEVILLASVS